MSEYVTKDELKVAMREQTDEIIGVIQSFVQQMDDRFNGVELKIDTLESKVNQLELEIGELKESHNRLLNTIDGFIGRIDKYETELLARDSQFEKLLAWARKVSEKTGIPLENL